MKAWGPTAAGLASAAFLGLLPIALLALFVVDVPRATYAWDFHAFWHAAHEVVRGGNPYSPGGVNAHGQAIPAFVYPPILAELIAPLGWLPFFSAAVVFIAVSAAAVIGALWVLGVRDWRCYGASFLWFPTLHALRLGTLTPILVLALALVLRLERRPLREATLALTVGLKLFLWPLWFWHGSLRGFRRLVPVVFLTIALVIGSWALVGFDGLAGYPDLLRSTEQQWVAGGYGVATALHAAGVPTNVLTLLLSMLTLFTSFGIVLLRRRRRVNDGEAFALFVVLAILLSPVMWLHYAALLAVPVAVLSRDFSPAWCVPLVFWATPYEESHGSWWRLLVGMGTVLATVGIAAVRARGRVGTTALQRTGVGAAAPVPQV